MGSKSVNDEIIDIDAMVDEDVDDVSIVDDVTIDDEPLDVDDYIEQAVQRQTRVIKANYKAIEKRVDAHDERITTLEKNQAIILKKVNALSKGAVDVDDIDSVDDKDELDDRNILDKTLGTVGNILHGVVDTAAFVLESTVDLVTLGRAKRE